MTANAVIATTPTGMAAAQGQLIQWVDEKLAAIAGEFQTNELILGQLRLARMATIHAERAMDSLRRRERFYTKVRAALEAGYYIIPPFDCQVFAVRTDRANPPEDTSRCKNPRNDARVPALAPGKGEYVHPVPSREWKFESDRKSSDGTKMVTETYYGNTAWKEVEFPMMAMKPELIEATHEAMGLKIFDTLGIMPRYRAADPIIVGTIKHYKSNQAPLTFFVAWWMDRDQL
jgi:hypothetical protein